jgi:hypothetical protein
LISESDIGCEARQVVLAVCESLQRGSRAKSHPMAGDRVACRGAKDAAQMMGRDRQRACEPRQWAAGLRGQQFASAVDEAAASAGGGWPSGSNAVWIDLLERRAGERDGSFDELALIGAFAASGEQ